MTKSPLSGSGNAAVQSELYNQCNIYIFNDFVFVHMVEFAWSFVRYLFDRMTHKEIKPEWICRSLYVLDV